MKITFKEFLIESVDRQVYELKLKTNIDAYKINNYKLGVLEKNMILYGLKADILDALKSQKLDSLEVDIQLSTNYIASEMIMQLPKKCFNECVRKTINNLEFGIKLLGPNSSIVNSTNVLVIHEKSFDCSKLIRPIPDKEMRDIWNSYANVSLLDDFCLAIPGKTHIANKDENYIWLEEHLHETTSKKQKEEGHFAFHLPKPSNKYLLISASGYVRIDPNTTHWLGSPSLNSVIHKPTGDTAEERKAAAFKKAVEYVKKNL